MRLAIAALLLFTGAACAAELTGRWFAAPERPDHQRRTLTLALTQRGEAIAGRLETTTRRAQLRNATFRGNHFQAIAQFNWDNRPQRFPVQGMLAEGTLRVSLAGWPGGPIQEWTLRRISPDPTLPEIATAPLPPVANLPPNGLALTPPMGWNSWNRFGCKIDDRMIRETADVLVSSGMRDAGYVYLNIDDCWQGTRDAQGRIQADPQRFPDMAALAAYVHGRGLKLGIYSSPGPRTCAGFEGSFGHEEQDARTYAQWGIDYLKYDWCSAARVYRYDQMPAVYSKMGRALQSSGRQILYSLCQYGVEKVWAWGPRVGGNAWRTTSDIGASWSSISEIGFDRQAPLARYAGPGHWNDPDMLEVGNGPLTPDENRTHFSLWALLAAPLLAGNDLRSMTAEVKSVLTHREVIAIDQDRLGQQAARVQREGQTEVWSKRLADGGSALGLFNRGAATATVTIRWSTVGLAAPPREIRDVWAATDHAVRGPMYTATVPPHGVVLLRVRR